jgi:hypothetical protein
MTAGVAEDASQDGSYTTSEFADTKIFRQHAP